MYFTLITVIKKVYIIQKNISKYKIDWDTVITLSQCYYYRFGFVVYITFKNSNR
jgi:hypothetical protein